MLTHVVCFKFNDPEKAKESVERLVRLREMVPSLRHIEAGLDITRSPRSYDVALVTRFDDAEGLAAYQVHPAHEEVAAFIRLHMTGAVAVDYLG